MFHQMIGGGGGCSHGCRERAAAALMNWTMLGFSEPLGLICFVGLSESLFSSPLCLPSSGGLVGSQVIGGPGWCLGLSSSQLQGLFQRNKSGAFPRGSRQSQPAVSSPSQKAHGHPIHSTPPLHNNHTLTNLAAGHWHRCSWRRWP